MCWWSRQDQWTLFVTRLQQLEGLTHNSLSMAPKEAPEALSHLAAAIQKGLRLQEWRPTQLPVIKALLPTLSRTWSFGNAGGILYISCFFVNFCSCYGPLFVPLFQSWWLVRLLSVQVLTSGVSYCRWAWLQCSLASLWYLHGSSYGRTSPLHNFECRGSCWFVLLNPFAIM